MHKWIAISLVFFCLGILQAQETVLSGKVLDAKSGKSLPFSNIIFNDTKGITADSEGSYHISLTPGIYHVRVTHMGYESLKDTIELFSSEYSREIDFSLYPSTLYLDDVVVSASRYAQRIANTSVSMQVLKADRISNEHSFDLESSLQKLPGVDIIDGQANIRSGSGWSYGAGSRVLVMVDGLPLLSPDASDAKWNLLPMENISQVEVLKGASSALYGSSALNGVINIRTSWPGPKPETRFSLLNGVYLDPKRKELIWDDHRIAVYSGAQILHSRRIGNLDLVIGANAYTDPGYRQDNFEKRRRVNTKIRYRDRKVKGLDYGLSASLMQLDLKDFLLWKNAKEGAWVQNPDAVTHNQGHRIYLDPFVNYYSTNGARHQLRSRWFRTYNGFPDDPEIDNEASQLFTEYQYHRGFGFLELTSGLVYSRTWSEAKLFGDHNYQNFAVFAQADMQWEKLSLSLGGRWEYFELDDEEDSRPVFRAGMNYRVAPYSFLRASFGQGFRFPSIAEKYTTTSVGGVNIFPNPYLGSEEGWNAELGFRQGYSIGGFEGFLDVAAFWTEYRDMMEFSFGFYDTVTYLPTTEYISFDNMGFQSQNIGNALIRGIDVSLTGRASFGKVNLEYLIGYTYTDPSDQNTDSLYRAGKSCDGDMLKYRYKSSLTGDIGLAWKRMELGISHIRRSYMECIDQVFVDPFLGQLILPGYAEYREEHKDEPYSRTDVRIGFQLSKSVKASIMVRNLFNRENIGRPGDLGAGRSIVLQLSGSF